ncbi:hypothetical protein C0Q70_11838, partial [Pomacea canaliculata]
PNVSGSGTFMRVMEVMASVLTPAWRQFPDQPSETAAAPKLTRLPDGGRTTAA